MWFFLLQLLQLLDVQLTWSPNTSQDVQLLLSHDSHKTLVNAICTAVFCHCHTMVSKKNFRFFFVSNTKIKKDNHLIKTIDPINLIYWFFRLFTVPAGNDWLKDVDDRVQFGVRFGKARGFIKTGDRIIVVTGWKQGSGFTNTMRNV